MKRITNYCRILNNTVFKVEKIKIEKYLKYPYNIRMIMDVMRYNTYLQVSKLGNLRKKKRNKFFNT